MKIPVRAGMVSPLRIGAVARAQASNLLLSAFLYRSVELTSKGVSGKYIAR